MRSSRLKAPGTPVRSFSQADVDAGRLSFVLVDQTATVDAFDFVVQDGSGATLSQATFQISVVPRALQIDAPETSDPGAPEPPVETPGVPESEGERPPEPDDGAALPGDTGGGTQGADVVLVETRILFGPPPSPQTP